MVKSTEQCNVHTSSSVVSYFMWFNRKSNWKVRMDFVLSFCCKIFVTSNSHRFAATTAIHFNMNFESDQRLPGRHDLPNRPMLIQYSPKTWCHAPHMPRDGYKWHIDAFPTNVLYIRIHRYMDTALRRCPPLCIRPCALFASTDILMTVLKFKLNSIFSSSS